MPKEKSETKTSAAVALCRKFPNAPSRTLAKRLMQEWGGTIEQSRNVIRLVRGTSGKENRSKRKCSQVEYEPKYAGWKPTPPPDSLAEDWLPFELDGVKRLGVITDPHIPYHNQTAFVTAVQTLKGNKCDGLLLNGDYADFYAISRWQKNPKKRDFAVERRLLRQGLEYIRGEFPKARIVFKKGNHEERWDHYLWNHAPEVSDMEALLMQHWLGFDDLGIEMVEDQRPVIFSRLPILHGHELGKSIFSPVNPARGAFLRTKHCCMVGHSHQTSAHSDPDMFHDETFVWSVGCLCDMTPEYARINRWNHGFAQVDGNGSEYDVQNFRIGKNGHVRSS